MLRHFVISLKIFMFDITCKQCSVCFSVRFKSELYRQFCSHKCADIYWSRKHIKARPIKPCVICGKQVKGCRPAEIIRNRCCSNKCAGIYSSKHGLKRGENNGRWKGGISIYNGYFTMNINKTAIHRKIMEEHIGKKLAKEECVHHLNGNKTDNRIENLVIMTNAEHSRHHMKKRILARRLNANRD